MSTLFHSVELTPPHSFTGGIEGPVCDMNGNLYAVNCQHDGSIGVVPVGTTDAKVWINLPENSIGCGMVRTPANGILVADYVGHHIYCLDVTAATVRVYCHEPRMNQPNDLAITQHGIVFATDPDWPNQSGQLWRIGLDGDATLIESAMGTTNGIEIAPDEHTVYVNETVQRRIWAYSLSETGDLLNKRLFVEFSDFGLDGMRCDLAGNLYVTRYGKGCIAKLSPDGDITLEIPLLGKDCTNLTFGGDDGCNCYVTLADRGNVEMFRVDIPGRPWALWRNTAEGN
jgi:gluconolactonase